jgi:hypothetical protein
MKKSLWFGLLLISASWLFFIPIFTKQDEKIGFLLLIVGIICNIFSFWKSKPIYLHKKYLFLLIPLSLSILIIPYPFNIGIILFAISIIISALSNKILTGDKANAIFKGLSLTGFILIFQAAFFPFYQIFVSHGHRVDILSPIISAIGNFLGLKTSVNNGIVFIQTIQQTYPFTITWEKFGFFIWLNILIGAMILFILIYRKQKILSHILIFLSVSAIYLILRCITLIHLYITMLELEIFWNPWFMLLSFLPLVLLLMKILPLNSKKSVENKVIMPNLTKKHVIVMIIFFIFIFSIVGALTFQDPGSKKEGRVLIDEYHSEWEDTIKPLDKEWYGMLSTYNYYSWAEWLNHYYQIEKNVNDVLNLDLLDKYDILILKCPTNAYSGEEINAITQFVEKGGGLFLIGDHTDVFGMNTFLNQVSQQFGIRFRTDATYEIGTGMMSIYKPDQIFSNPIVKNLKQFEFMTSCTLDAPLFSENVIIGNRIISEPGTYSTENFFRESVASPESEFGFLLQASAVKYGKGRVIAFTDSTVFSSFSVFTDGYQKFTLGVLDYLNRENVFAYLNTVFIGLAGISFILLVYVLRKERKVKAVFLCLSIGLLSFSLATPFFSYVNSINYSLPSPHSDFKQICFVQEYSDFNISLKPRLIISEGKQNYGTFFVWTQRVSGIPSVELTLDNAIKKGDIIVFINPKKSFKDSDINAINDFVKNGGKILVMDSVQNSKSTTNELIGNFGIWINENIQNQRLFLNNTDIFENRTIGNISYPYLSIIGGETMFINEKNETQISIVELHNKITGKNGTIVVVVDSYTFSDASMGGTFSEPNDNQILIYKTEYFIFEELLSIQG